MPPQNLEAEQAVLGGIFLRGSIFHELVDILSQEDFYSPGHGIIYAAFTELYRVNTPIDLVTAAEQLKQMGRLEDVGGALYLAELAQATISGANALHHARIVRDKAVQRELIFAASDIIDNCFDGSMDVVDLLDKSEQAVFTVAQRTATTPCLSSKALLDKVFEDLAARCERKELVTGVATTYHKLDEVTAGFQPSDLIVIAGRPSMGKTAFALNVAMRTAVLKGVPTLFFSLEMSMDQLMQRMLASWSKVSLKDIRRGHIPDESWARLYDAANHLSPAPIFIDDTAALGVMEMRARCRRLRGEKDIGLIVVDYLQLMRASRHIDSREQEIADISRNLKALAKELNVPVVALSQLNRKVEERGDKKPMLSDLRESGAIEQDADVILFLYREAVYNKNIEEGQKNVAHVIVGKQRNGPSGEEIPLLFHKESTAFEELDPVHVPPSESFGT